MSVFNDYAYYYNLFYGDKDYYGETIKINELIEKYHKGTGKKLLNIGCGTGRHDYELYRIGYRTHGIDLSEKMIEVAQHNYSTVEENNMSFAVGDARTYRDGKKYDIVTSLFHVMSYQNSNEDLLSSFKTAYEEMENHGLFIFDAWYGPGVLTDRPSVRVKRVSDKKNDLIRYADPVMHFDKNVVDVNYEIHIINKADSKTSVIKETHCMRYLFEPEVSYMLNQSGLRLINVLDCNTLEMADDQSWTAFFIAGKL